MRIGSCAPSLLCNCHISWVFPLCFPCRSAAIVLGTLCTAHWCIALVHWCIGALVHWCKHRLPCTRSRSCLIQAQFSVHNPLSKDKRLFLEKQHIWISPAGKVGQQHTRRSKRCWEGQLSKSHLHRGKGEYWTSKHTHSIVDGYI